MRKWLKYIFKIVINNYSVLSIDLNLSVCICPLQVTLSYKWIRLSLKGIDYYNTYYKLPLLFCVTFLGLGWITLLLLETNSTKKSQRINKFYKLLINVTFLMLAASSCFFISGNNPPILFVTLIKFINSLQPNHFHCSFIYMRTRH